MTFAWAFRVYLCLKLSFAIIVVSEEVYKRRLRNASNLEKALLSPIFIVEMFKSTR